MKFSRFSSVIHSECTNIQEVGGYGIRNIKIKRNGEEKSCLLYISVQPAPFVKPHCVLTAAIAAVLLIDWRSAHTDVRSQKHTSMFLLLVHRMAELVKMYNENRKMLLTFYNNYNTILTRSEQLFE